VIAVRVAFGYLRRKMTVPLDRRHSGLHAKSAKPLSRDHFGHAAAETLARCLLVADTNGTPSRSSFLPAICSKTFAAVNAMASRLPSSSRISQRKFLSHQLPDTAFGKAPDQARRLG